jgi:hypothetical protein
MEGVMEGVREGLSECVCVGERKARRFGGAPATRDTFSTFFAHTAPGQKLLKLRSGFSSCLGRRVQGQGLGLGVQGSGFRVQGSGCRVQG